MNPFLASSAKALLAATTLTVTVPVVNAMPYQPSQLAAASQLILVDHDDDRMSISRYRAGNDGWSRFRGDPRDDDDDDDDDDD